jgi:hypothetical protein
MAKMEKLSASLTQKHAKLAKPDKNVSREFQLYGYQLAEKLGDLKHKALYMKLAKEIPRNILEQTLSFVADYNNAKSKGKLFMYKLRLIQTEKNKKTS